ncbi:MAG: hypothetical protein WCA77_09690 [Thermoplasmata archaeon]
METPQSEGGGLLPSPATPTRQPRAAADRIGREAIRFLQTAVIPELLRRKERGLASHVRNAVRDEDLVVLGHMNERDRRSLLEAMEGRLAQGEERPRAVVRLTAILAGVAAPDVRFARWRTVPAR